MTVCGSVDRQDFIKTLAEACEKTGWQVHAYCLLSNHYHLVVETPEPNLVAGMAWLQSTYTIRLNHRHKFSGHLFSGRPGTIRAADGAAAAGGDRAGGIPGTAAGLVFRSDDQALTTKEGN